MLRQAAEAVPLAGRMHRIAPQHLGIGRWSVVQCDRPEVVAVHREASVPNLASQMRVAFSSIALNTGSSSPGELLMTFSTSAVAVCCCERLARSSLSSRVFSMAITAWAAKFVSNSICLSVNGPYLLAIDDNGADQLVFLEHRHDDMRAGAGGVDQRDDAGVARDIALARAADRECGEPVWSWSRGRSGCRG